MPEQEQKTLPISISTMAVLKVVGIFVLLWLVYLIRDVLAILFVALIFASAVDSWVDKLQKRKIPRPAGILLIYIFIFGLISLAVVLIIPPIVEQVRQLTDIFPAFWEKLLAGYGEVTSNGQVADSIQNSLKTLDSRLSQAAGGVFATITGIFGGIISFFVILVITFYMVVQEDSLKRVLRSVAPERYESYFVQLFTRIQTKIGLWLQGQVLLSLIIGLLTFIGLKLLGVEYALVLALIAALAEFVPFLGPIIAGIPAVFLTFVQSPFRALLVIVLYFVLQQLENHIIVPKVMQKALGLNPVVIIIVIMIGFKLGGVVGALLSIPVTTAISVWLKDLFSDKAPQVVFD